MTCSFSTVFLFEGSGSRFLTLDLIRDGTKGLSGFDMSLLGHIGNYSLHAVSLLVHVDIGV